jgi:hypothetical protein
MKFKPLKMLYFILSLSKAAIGSAPGLSCGLLFDLDLNHLHPTPGHIGEQASHDRDAGPD